MKMIREPVDAMVLFNKDSISPILVTYSGGNLKINRVIKTWKERRNLRECIIYLCQSEGRIDPTELRWDMVLNKWFIEKL